MIESGYEAGQKLFTAPLFPKFLLFPLLFLIALNAWAHGENKPGPNGGIIRMPGSFHVEVVSHSKGEFLVFLLDGEFRNPTTKNSSVKVFHVVRKEKRELTCHPRGKAFHCKSPQGAKAVGGELEIGATRLGEEGELATVPVF